jgi:hypothetical protein
MVYHWCKHFSLLLYITGTRRQSIVEPPFVFPVNLSFLHVDRKTYNSSDIPEKVEHNDLMYGFNFLSKTKYMVVYIFINCIFICGKQ